MSEVRLINLQKKYDGTVAVDDLSLEVKNGEFVVLLGPSGCGKTTTLRCIAGLETADQGDIIIDGNMVNDLRPKERDVAMVFQNYALYPHMTVFENIAYPLRMRKMPKDKIEAQVKEIAERLNISRFLLRRPRQLSGGEQQRVALGRALVRRPKVFLMDEPLSNLDAKLRLVLRAELRRLQDELKITTIYVTHDQAEAMALADKVAVMKDGKLLQFDSPSNIYGRPSSVFAAGFIGNPPMNLMSARSTTRDGTVTIDAGLFTYNLPMNMTEKLGNNPTEREVLVGIRAEDLMISRKQAANSVFQAEISVLENLGLHVVVDLKAQSNFLKSVVPSSSDLQRGITVWVGFDPSKIHLFDTKTEEAIL
jgi:multiple sugar transport system ATP-binding protein